MIVICPTCNQDREVGRNMAWRISTGRNKNCKSCSIKARPRGNRLGSTQPESFKLAMSMRMRGNQFAKGSERSEDHLARLVAVNIANKYNLGKRPWNWRGGVTPESRLQRVVFQKTIQKKVLGRDDYTCQICKAIGGKLQVDHIKSWADYPELRFEEDNCRTLCQECHYEVTFGMKLQDKSSQWGNNLIGSQRKEMIAP